MTREDVIAMLPAVAKRSDDPDTQTACISTVRHWDDNYIVEATAANQLPWKLRVTPERIAKPRKYAFIQHAEMVMLGLHVGTDTCFAGRTIFINWFPCAQCAGALINAGIRALDCDRARYEERKDDSRYTFAEAMEMLNEAGVDIHWH
jgi:dCMP deaminase